MSDTNAIPAPPLAAPSPGVAQPAPPALPLAPEAIESSVQNWEALRESHPAPPIATRVDAPSFKTNEWQDGVQFGVTAGFYIALVGFVALHVLVGNLRQLAATDGAEPHGAIMARYGKIALSSLFLSLSGFLLISAQFG